MEPNHAQVPVISNTQQFRANTHTFIFQCIQNHTITIEREFGETTFNELLQEEECFNNACMQILAIKLGSIRNKPCKANTVERNGKETQPSNISNMIHGKERKPAILLPTIRTRQHSAPRAPPQAAAAPPPFARQTKNRTTTKCTIILAMEH